MVLNVLYMALQSILSLFLLLGFDVFPTIMHGPKLLDRRCQKTSNCPAVSTCKNCIYNMHTNVHFQNQPTMYRYISMPVKKERMNENVPFDTVLIHTIIITVPLKDFNSDGTNDQSRAVVASQHVRQLQAASSSSAT